VTFDLISSTNPHNNPSVSVVDVRRKSKETNLELEVDITGAICIKDVFPLEGGSEIQVPRYMFINSCIEYVYVCFILDTYIYIYICVHKRKYIFTHLSIYMYICIYLYKLLYLGRF
jgi:hypothetical protein